MDGSECPLPNIRGRADLRLFKIGKQPFFDMSDHNEIHVEAFLEYLYFGKYPSISTLAYRLYASSIQQGEEDTTNSMAAEDESTKKENDSNLPPSADGKSKTRDESKHRTIRTESVSGNLLFHVNM